MCSRRHIAVSPCVKSAAPPAAPHMSCQMSAPSSTASSHLPRVARTSMGSTAVRLSSSGTASDPGVGSNAHAEMEQQIMTVVMASNSRMSAPCDRRAGLRCAGVGRVISAAFAQVFRAKRRCARRRVNLSPSSSMLNLVSLLALGQPAIDGWEERIMMPGPPSICMKASPRGGRIPSLPP